MRAERRELAFLLTAQDIYDFDCSDDDDELSKVSEG